MNDGKPALLLPSTQHEGLWVSIVFGGFFLWDIVTKYVSISKGNAQKNSLLRRSGISFYCLALALFIWARYTALTPVVSVVLVDVALMAIIMLHRALKHNKPVLSIFFLCVMASACLSLEFTNSSNSTPIESNQ